MVGVSSGLTCMPPLPSMLAAQKSISGGARFFGFVRAREPFRGLPNLLRVALARRAACLANTTTRVVLPAVRLGGGALPGTRPGSIDASRYDSKPASRRSLPDFSRSQGILGPSPLGPPMWVRAPDFAAWDVQFQTGFTTKQNPHPAEIDLPAARIE